MRAARLRLHQNIHSIRETLHVTILNNLFEREGLRSISSIGDHCGTRYACRVGCSRIARSAVTMNILLTLQKYWNSSHRIYCRGRCAIPDVFVAADSASHDVEFQCHLVEESRKWYKIANKNASGDLSSAVEAMN